MPRYVALLRGINVSGQKIIKMEALREALSELPFTQITTYIQSGNLLFHSELSDAKTISGLISDKIRSRFGHEVVVLITDPTLLIETAENNPYSQRTSENATQPYIGFLSGIPASQAIAELAGTDFKNDEFTIIGDKIYIWYADSAGNTKLTNAVIEKKLGVSGTMRNWKTLQKLIALSSL